MGGTSSKNEADTAVTVFSAEEVTILRKQYDNIANSKEEFQKNLGNLHADLTHAFVAYLSSLDSSSSQKKNVLFTFRQYQTMLAHVYKGTVSDKAAVLKGLCCSEADVKADVLFKTLRKLVITYRNVTRYLDMWSTWVLPADSDEGSEHLTLSLLYELFTKGHNKKDGVPNVTVPTDICYTESDLEECMSRSPMFMLMFDAIFMGLFPLEQEALACKEKLATYLPIPEATPTLKNTILDAYSLTYLNFNLLKDLQSEWRLLFSNSVYGDSYTQLVSHILNKGPSVLIVKDKDGNIFGGYNSQKWELNSKFYGAPDCFLFTLSPQYGVFNATSYNSNFVYLNQGQQTLPNGLGMGGQFDYFGLWIDQSFNYGHSKAKPRCTTYGSPQLSRNPEFELVAIEVWEVGPLPKSDDSDDEEKTPKKKSILDQNNEAKAMLALIGKEQVSMGLREEDEEDLTVEMKQKMNVIPPLI